MRSVRSLLALLTVPALAAASVVTAQAQVPAELPFVEAQAEPEPQLPIIFVHGQSGSAQQFETQAMRFTSNGYPQDLLYAYEYDTSSSATDLARLDAYIDDVLAETGAEQVHAVGHSRGTFVWTQYLSNTTDDIDGASKVAKYANVDGRTAAELPGGVPTIGIWGEWNTSAQIGPDPAYNFHLPTQSHTETTTGPEAFWLMYSFFTGTYPETTMVVAEAPDEVTIAGRAVLFPQNTGYTGSTVEAWPVDPATGQRRGDEPVASIAIDESGEFGPIEVDGEQHYELAVVRPGDAGEHHFYFEPFLRDDHFVRLNTSLPGEGVSAAVPTSASTTNINVVRNREFWGDQGAESDRLTIDGTSVVEANTSPRRGVNLAVFAYDDGLDGTTDVAKGELPPFNTLPFLTAIDVAIPASADGRRPVAVVQTVRGNDDDTTEINVPNLPSSTDSITVQFRDFTNNTK